MNGMKKLGKQLEAMGIDCSGMSNDDMAAKAADLLDMNPVKACTDTPTYQRPDPDPGLVAAIPAPAKPVKRAVSQPKKAKAQ